MEIKEKVPSLSTENGREHGQVRLLGKVEDVDEFQLPDFNKLVKSSIKTLEEMRGNGSVLLQNDLLEEIKREDLMERHLSYRVEVREGKVGNNGDSDTIVEESSTFKVILRAQPHDAIEINGPHEIAYPYKDALKETFVERNDEEISFQNILKE